jgi:hypothetical protein
MPRKYEVPIFTGCGHAVSSCTCKRRHGEAATGKVVTAIDERDVEPLVEAGRAALDLFEGPEHEVGEKLVAALKPFEAEEGSSG